MRYACIVVFPSVPYRVDEDDPRAPSQENTTSCAPPSLVSVAREPAELTSSSPLISTPSVT